MLPEFDPQKFMEHVPEKDSSGYEMPPWKRHIVARQLAEKAQRDADEQKLVRFNNMIQGAMPEANTFGL